MLICFLITLITAIVIVFANQYSMHNTEKRFEENLLKGKSTLWNKIRLYEITLMENNIKALTRSKNLIKAIQANDSQALDTYAVGIYNRLSTLHIIDNLVLVNRDGQVVYTADTKNNIVGQAIHSTLLNNTRESGKLYSGLALNANKQLSVQVVVPLTRRGQLIGFGILEKNLSDIMADFKKSDNSQVALLSKAGKIQNSTDEKIFKQLSLQAYPPKENGYVYVIKIKDLYHTLTYIPLKSKNNKLLGYAAILTNYHASFSTQEKIDTIAIITAIIIMLALLAVMYFFLKKSIIKPLRFSVGFANKIAQGDLEMNTQSQANQLSKDEIGELLSSLNNMQTGLLKAKQDEEKHLQIMEEQQRLTQKKMKETQKVIETCKHSLESLSEGDLDAYIHSDFPEEFAPLKQFINSTLDKLTGIISQTKCSSSTVTQNAAIISSGNMDLSNRTEKQSEHLSNTAASMEEITTVINNGMEQVNMAASLSVQAKDIAQAGSNSMGQVVTAMHDIDTSSKEIEQINGLINEIAFQTNLLALNASVEAARAGENGRGFAVVAQEVRHLSQRSADAARNINELIEQSLGYVKAGLTLVNQTKDSLDKIVTSINEVSDIAVELKSSANEQVLGSNQVNQSLAQLDKFTQQNASLVEEAAASAETMASEAKKMSELINYFSTPK